MCGKFGRFAAGKPFDGRKPPQEIVYKAAKRPQYTKREWATPSWPRKLENDPLRGNAYKVLPIWSMRENGRAEVERIMGQNTENVRYAIFCCCLRVAVQTFCGN